VSRVKTIEAEHAVNDPMRVAVRKEIHDGGRGLAGW